MKNLNNPFGKNTRTVLSLGMTLLLAFSSCHERSMEPLVGIDSKPETIMDVSVENENGASTVYYTLPDDPQLLYVEAEYTLSDGELRSVKSSIFKNFVKLEGFVSTEEREITLYTVNRGEKKSDPVRVTIKPLISPLEIAYQSLVTGSDFGGVNVKYENELEHEYVLNLLHKVDGEWLVYDRFYSSVKDPSVIFRGFEAEPQDFGVFLVDKWRNRSDTLIQNITPLYEVEVNKELMRHYPLDNDYYEPRLATRPISNLWNGPSTADAANFSLLVYDGLTFPWWFTIDLGREYQVGRMKLFQSPAPVNNPNTYSYYFNNISPKVFEVYGSNEPAVDGSWDSWTLLERFEAVKPSGQPIGNNTAEDIAAGNAGLDFTFSNYEQGYRYIRINVLDTWSSQMGMILQELTFWGAPVE